MLSPVCSYGEGTVGVGRAVAPAVPSGSPSLDETVRPCPTPDLVQLPEPVEMFVFGKRVSRNQTSEQGEQGVQCPVTAQLPCDRT